MRTMTLLAVAVVAGVLVVGCHDGEAGGEGEGEGSPQTLRGLAATETDDPVFGVVAAHENGEKLAVMVARDDEDRIVGVTGAVWVSPEGEEVVVHAENNLPTRVVVGEHVFLFRNYTATTVDVAVVTPDGAVSVKEGVELDATYLAALDLDVAQKPSTVRSALFDEEWSLGSVVRVALGAVGVASCGAAFVLSHGALLPIVQACVGTVLAVGAALLPEDNEALEAAGAGMDAVSCAGGHCAGVIGRMAEQAAEEAEEANDRALTAAGESGEGWCTPRCAGRECGNNWCGGRCDPGCQPERRCSALGRCEAGGEDCECQQGPCCDGCDLRRDYWTCENGVDVEYRCDGSECGSDAQRRFRLRRCSGASASCDGDLVWGAWNDIDDCSPDEACRADASGASCVSGQCGGEGEGEGEGTGDAGIEWVRIPGGRFNMGSEDGDDNELPVHPVDVPTFELAQTEVTVAQYRACVDAGRCEAPDTRGYECNWGVDGRGDHPVNCVDWEQARAFAAFVGGRLPSEAEWEYAARSGGRDQTYPWGDEEATCARVVAYDGGAGCGEDRTWPVCSKPTGSSAHGVCDLAGNVWEWVEDCYHDSYAGAPGDGRAWEGCGALDARVLRGGSWNSYAEYCRSAGRAGPTPGRRAHGLGLRPARSP